MKKNILVAGLCIFAILAIGSIAYLSATEEHMVFPKRPHGGFVQPPELTEENGVKKIRWILPEDCTYVSYEVQEVGYAPDTATLWGGVTEVLCTEQENGFLCEAEVHPDMQERDGRWNIQASAYECASGKFYISEVVTTE